MTAAKKAGARKSAPATAKKTIKFHGIEIDVPETLPMSWGLRVARLLGDDEGSVTDLVELLDLALDTETMDRVTAALDKKRTATGGYDVLFSLISDIETAVVGSGE